MTQEFLASAKALQVFSNPFKLRCNGLVERQNRTLAHMLKVFCSRHMDDWDKFLPQVVGAYNGTRHATTGVSPHMLLTGYTCLSYTSTLNFRKPQSLHDSMFGKLSKDSRN